MSPSPSARAGGALVLAVALAVSGTALVRALDEGAVLDVSGAPQVVTPGDGDAVAERFVLSWTRGDHDGSFAVVLDARVVRPGEVVQPGDTTVVTDGTSLVVGLGARADGSPSAKDWHRLTVVPVDAAGRRAGERTAVVHVRTSPGPDA